jgi:hypothetical protein
MRRLLLFLLAGLIALVAQPALANQVVVRGSVPHHHHFFFRNHNRIIFGSPFFFRTTPFVTRSPFAQTTPFVSASPFVLSMNPFFFDGGIFPTSSFGGFSGGFGAPVALGGSGEFADGGAGGEPRIIVVAAPFAGPPRRPAEPAHATIEQTPFGVTIIRGSGSSH